MKNRINAFLFSVKSSISNKPMALLLLMLIISLTVVITGSLAKTLIADAEDQMYSSAKIEAIDAYDIDIVKCSEVIKSLRESGFITADEYCKIYTDFYSATIENLGSNHVYNLNSSSIVYVVSPNEYFTENLLASGKKGAVISKDLADKIGANVGDKINISNVPNNDYEVLDIREYSATGFYANEPVIFLPYYAPLTNVVYKRGGEFKENYFGTPYISISDLSRMPTGQERVIAKGAGLEIRTGSFFNVSGIIWYILILALMIFFVLNILYILNYIDKVNVKKFTVMKIVGAKPSFLIWATYLEVMVVALIGMGIGMGIEDAIFKSLLGLSVDKLLWVGYVFEVVITALTVFVATTVRVIRRGRSARIDRRSL